MNLVDKVQHFIQRHKLISKADHIVVGVSAGADSVTLLHILYALKHSWGLQLHIAHFNHNLRPTAARDQKFVEQLAQQLNLPFTTETLPKFKLQKAKGSIEENARNYRLSFLARVAKKVKADHIALAHTQDDLAETVLMRLIRGAGLQGLRGILPAREMAQSHFIRPLLETRRKDIEQYLKTRHLTFRTDPTNRQTKFFRNKVRLNLLPILEKEYNPNIKEVLTNIADTSCADYELLETMAQKAYKKMAQSKKGKNTVAFNLTSFTNLHQALQRMLIRLAIAHLQGNMNRLTLTHLNELETLIATKPKGSKLQLPKQITIEKTAVDLIIKHENH